MRFELRQTKSGDFQFTLEANGEVLLTSEVFHRKENAVNALESVRKNASIENRFDRRVNMHEKDYFVLKATNHEIIGVSEAFDSAEALEDCIRSIMAGAAARTLRT